MDSLRRATRFTYEGFLDIEIATKTLVDTERPFRYLQDLKVVLLTDGSEHRTLRFWIPVFTGMTRLEQ